jgi:hypothetical protein
MQIIKPAVEGTLIVMTCLLQLAASKKEQKTNASNLHSFLIEFFHALNGEKPCAGLVLLCQNQGRESSLRFCRDAQLELKSDNLSISHNGVYAASIS